jgi:hypothetical protein
VARRGKKQDELDPSIPQLADAYKQMPDAPKQSAKGSKQKGSKQKRGGNVFQGADHDAVNSLVNRDPMAGADHHLVNSVVQRRGRVSGGAAAAWIIGALVVAGIAVAIYFFVRSGQRHR